MEMPVPRFAMSSSRLAAVIGGALLVAVMMGVLGSTSGKPTTSAGGPTMAPISPAKVCPGRFRIEHDGEHASIPLCTTTDLAVGDPSLTRLVVVVHGDGRNAPSYFDDVVRSAVAADATGVLVIAPQFPTRGDLRRAEVADDVLTWTAESWKSGERSRPGEGSLRIDSFDLVDRLIGEVVDGGRFPAIETVVVAGHSAGGQFVNRYAAGSRIDSLLQRADVDLRFIVANPSSYLYFDGRRVGDDGVVAIPGRSARADCPGYDRYKYGLDERNPYLATSTRREIRDRYRARTVSYVAGALDTDPEETSLDRSCAGRMQGRTRLDRARAYHAYLEATFDAADLEHHVLTIVPGVGHEGGAILNDALVRPLLFGSGSG